MEYGRRNDGEVLRRSLRAAEGAEPDAPAAVLAGECPPGFALLTRSLHLGHGERTFLAAGLMVLQWDVHRRSGLAVESSRDRAHTGVDVALGATFGPVMVAMSCRVLEVYEGARRLGFSYATLPGHAECGREDFAVELGDDGQVWFRLRGVSRPSAWPMRAGGPPARWLQRRANDAYLRSFGPAHEGQRG